MNIEYTHRPKISVEIENISRIVVDRSARAMYLYSIYSREFLIRMDNIQTAVLCM